ncbi:MAG: rhodanese-like domain-containing protein [Bacteroidota bacterium]|jgi:rhodanese-related sulfurtransferase
MKEVSVQELKSMKDNSEDFQLIDVREEYEYDTCNLGGTLIPMGEVLENIEKISRDKKVVIHCRSGKRSATIVNALESQHGFSNLYNLAGGIMAWADQIDPTLPKY